MANATSSQARWDQWMFLVQARMLPTFTPTQWAHTKAPAHVHQRLYERFHERLATATRESMSQDLSGVHGPIHALFFEQARPPAPLGFLLSLATARAALTLARACAPAGGAELRDSARVAPDARGARRARALSPPPLPFRVRP